jgi:hypothetical protein
MSSTVQLSLWDKAGDSVIIEFVGGNSLASSLSLPGDLPQFLRHIPCLLPPVLELRG